MDTRLWIGVALLTTACGDPPPTDVRTWTPADHSQPAEVDPARVQAEPAAAADPARAVQALWKVACATCHGTEGRGDGGGSPPGANVPSFVDAAWQASRTDAELAQSIRAGRNLMPAFGEQLTDDGIQALVGHIRTLRP